MVPSRSIMGKSCPLKSPEIPNVTLFGNKIDTKEAKLGEVRWPVKPNYWHFYIIYKLEHRISKEYREKVI